MSYRDALRAAFEAAPDKVAFVEEARQFLHEELSPIRSQPIDRVRWVPVDRVSPNDYNPNSVAHKEMKLLYTSILHDGYTQPVVTVLDKSGEMVLPCGHVSSLGENHWIWTVKDPLSGSSAIPLAFLTEREASVSFTDENTKSGKVESECRSRKPTATTAAISANGYEISGDWEGSISKLASARSISGTCTGLTRPASFSLHVCPTCASSANRQKRAWTFSAVDVPASEGASGHITSWLSSETRAPAPELKTSRSGCIEASTPSEPSETNSASQPRTGTLALEVRNTSRAVIVDGFHRYFTCKNNADIRERNHGMLPIVVIDKNINDRMASTVRHNRARGKHSVAGMSSMVFSMLEEGWDDATICNRLGMEPEELLRLKHITGFSKLFENAEYRQAWVVRRQVAARKAYREQAAAEASAAQAAGG